MRTLFLLVLCGVAAAQSRIAAAPLMTASRSGALALSTPAERPGKMDACVAASPAVAPPNTTSDTAGHRSGTSPKPGTTYYVRADGTAGSKASATSAACASTAMSLSTQNAQTFSPGDTIVISDAGGVYRDAVLIPPSSGNPSAPITYVGQGSPVLSGAHVLPGSWQAEEMGQRTPYLLCTSTADRSDAGCAADVAVAGSLLIVATFSGNAATVGLTDTQHNSWSCQHTPMTYYGPYGGWGSLCFAIAQEAGTDTFTLTQPRAGALALQALEWDANAPSLVLDGRAQQSDQSSGAAISSGHATGSPLHQDDLIVGFTISQNRPSVGAGFTLASDLLHAGGTSYQATEYALGLGDAAATFSQRAGRFGIAVATFRSSGRRATAYHQASAKPPVALFRNHAWLKQVQRQSSLAPGTWFWDARHKDIWVYDNPVNALYEVPVEGNLLIDKDKSCLAFERLTFEEALNDDLYFQGNIDHIRLDHVQALRSAKGSGFNGQSQFPTKQQHWDVTNSVFSENDQNGFSQAGYAKDWRFDHDAFDHNVRYTVGKDRYDGGWRFVSAASPATNTQSDIVVQGSQAVGNGSSDLANSNTGDGFWCDTCGTGIQIGPGNLAKNNADAGILVEESLGVTVIGNVSQGNLGNGIRLYNHDRDSMVFANLVTGNKAQGILAEGLYGGGDPGFVHNTFVGNTSLHNATNLAAYFGAENDGQNGSGNTYKANDFGEPASHFIEFGSQHGFSSYPAWEMAYCGAVGCSQSYPPQTALSPPHITALVAGRGAVHFEPPFALPPQCLLRDTTNPANEVTYSATQTDLELSGTANDSVLWVCSLPTHIR